MLAQCGSGIRDFAPWPSRIVGGNCRAIWCRSFRRVLTLLDEARNRGDPATQPGFRLHRLKGDMAGLWSICVSGNWRVVFRFEDNEAADVDLVDYH